MGKAFLKFLGYISFKWVCFYVYQIAQSNKDWDWGRVKTKEDVYYTAWMLLALPVLELMILIFPFLLALKQKGELAVLILFIAFTLEFIIGWYATNQHLEVWMIVKIVLSMSLFFILYRNQLKPNIYKQSP